MTTEERLAKVERQLAELQHEVRTRRVTILDENGKTRALLAVDLEGPTLGLADEKGEVRARLVVNEDGPALCLADEYGKTIWKAP